MLVSFKTLHCNPGLCDWHICRACNNSIQLNSIIQIVLKCDIWMTWRRLFADVRVTAILWPSAGQQTEVKQKYLLPFTFWLIVEDYSVIAQVCPKRGHHEILQSKQPNRPTSISKWVGEPDYGTARLESWYRSYDKTPSYLSPIIIKTRYLAW